MNKEELTALVAQILGQMEPMVKAGHYHSTQPGPKKTPKDHDPGDFVPDVTEVDLNLCWTFGDPGPIARMTWLENLWWGGRKHLTNAEKQMLREALPNTHMELGYIASTDAGWRKLPNYYAMRDALGMFYMH